jgi:hypothetical protein
MGGLVILFFCFLFLFSFGLKIEEAGVGGYQICCVNALLGVIRARTVRMMYKNGFMVGRKEGRRPTLKNVGGGGREDRGGG